MQQLQLHQAQMQREQTRINEFWGEILKEVSEIDPEKEDFKTHELPLARIKKIMRLEDDVAESGTPRFMIAAEAPIIIAKACEIFVLEMAMRANSLTTENKRRTLQRNDIAMAVSKTDIYDFLIDIVPRDEIKKEEASQSVGDMEAQQQQHQQQQQQQQMQLMAMQHLGAHMTSLQEQQLMQQQQQAGAGVMEGDGTADANALAAHQAALQQQQEAIMAAVASNPQLAMQMQVLWQQQAQQALFLQHHQQQQQREGRAVEGAMGIPGLGVLGGQGEQTIEQQAASLAAMQSAMVSNPAMMQAFMGSAGAPEQGQQQLAGQQAQQQPEQQASQQSSPQQQQQQAPQQQQQQYQQQPPQQYQQQPTQQYQQQPTQQYQQQSPQQYQQQPPQQQQQPPQQQQGQNQQQAQPLPIPPATSVTGM
ncbi:unnamed protein product [Ascophyllum nodosum]